MIVMFGSRKGGCGKSTTAVNVCAALAKQGNDVVLVDADRQRTAAKWVLARDENPDLPQSLECPRVLVKQASHPARIFMIAYSTSLRRYQLAIRPKPERTSG